MQLKFGDKREVSRGVLPVNEKEGERKGKNGIGPRMKNGRGNHNKILKKAKSYYCFVSIDPLCLFYLIVQITKQV